MAETDAAGAAGLQWVQGARPGLVGELVRWHGLHYVGGKGWAPVFEAICAEQLGEIARQLGARDDVAAFSAWEGEAFLAGLVMDARGLERPGTRLRFLIASDAARGRGLGNALLRRALSWADACGRQPVWLTTVAGLDAAAHLYRKFGFEIVAEQVDRTWGEEHREQRWERRVA